ncbi:MAG: hypothetical protein Q8916_08390 [Bacteroidota bacterium]|nr:hypothetical protein [Bacteroidota bacterium]MDP4235816.1 hypothetical protein [Bacteroidota bacterium]
MDRKVRAAALLLVLLFSNCAFAQTKPDSATAPLDEYRHFIMPTGKPINGGYVGFWELAFIQAGVGLGNVFSFSGGITALPTVAFRSQFAFLQAKATLADEGGISFAVGGNLLRLTSDFLYFHAFASVTAELQNETRYTGLLFLKLSGESFPVIYVYPFSPPPFSFSYGGILGAGIGFDTPIKGVPNTRIVAEIWNHDLSSPSKIALLFALRLENSRFSSDFGFMYFSLPLLAPVANFVWRL